MCAGIDVLELRGALLKTDTATIIAAKLSGKLTSLTVSVDTDDIDALRIILRGCGSTLKALKVIFADFEHSYYYLLNIVAAHCPLVETFTVQPPSFGTIRSIGDIDVVFLLKRCQCITALTLVGVVYLKLTESLLDALFASRKLRKLWLINCGMSRKSISKQWIRKQAKQRNLLPVLEVIVEDHTRWDY